MVAACPFPANYGSPGAIREMSVRLAAMGHRIHVVTYPDGDDGLPLGGVHLHRAGKRDARAGTRVGPSLDKPLLDLRTLRELCRVIKEHGIEIIHAHNYEGALIGAAAKCLTGRPLLYHAVNLMADELHTYRFIRPAFVANALGRFLDWVTPRLADRIIALTPELEAALAGHGIPPERIRWCRAGWSRRCSGGGPADARPVRAGEPAGGDVYGGHQRLPAHRLPASGVLRWRGSNCRRRCS